MNSKLTSGLELKIPPVIIVALFAGLTILAGYNRWLMFRYPKVFDFWVIAPTVIGFIVALLGIIEFKKAQTTVDPTQPDKASKLVNSGVFKFTRNPMYLGMMLWSISIAFYAGSWLGFLSVVLCACYLTRYQILPEERIIEGLFKKDYVEYKNNVRRWI